jgi:hypothetical protein
MDLGIQLPSPQSVPMGPASPAASPQPAPQQINVGGIMAMKSLKTLNAEDETAKAIERANEARNDPVVTELVAMVQRHWSAAKTAKLMIEQDMLDAVRAKAGRYSAAKEAELAQQGGSQIYMMLFASKARQAKALLTDVLIGSGAEKPWTLSPSPKPDIPPEAVTQIVQGVQALVQQAEMGPAPMTVPEIRQLLSDAKERVEQQVMQQAREEARDAEAALEDDLVEGGYLEAVDEFLDDLTTFKSAFIKGPVLQIENRLTWEPDPTTGTSNAVVTEVKKNKWLRVDPFMVYPSAWSKGVQDSYLFERHRLSRGDLDALRKVDGYSEDSIRAVLEYHGMGGLHEWLQIDNAKATAENRNTTINAVNNDLIDALQYWGSVSGKMLRDWGMKGISDDAKEYPVELWLIGQWVIKCVLNPDPLSRRPYYSDGFSRIPGAFWHNSLYDLIKDSVDMCNAAARALANNLGISSGPQVGVNIDRIAPGEDVSEMYPWKIWQFSQDPLGSTVQPITFFQPESNAQQLLAVYDKFVLLADEYSGIPRYMTGTEGTPGAGRTASGLSMMVGNASKVIKALVTSIDFRITDKVLKRLFDWKMQFDKTFQYRGDLQIVPRGALSLQVKEAANQARLQFMQQTANPIDQQIMGVEGRAALLRESAKNLNMNPEDIVPSASVMRMKQVQAQQQQINQLQQQQQTLANQGQAQAEVGPQSGQTLQNGAPVTDNFSPQPQN